MLVGDPRLSALINTEPDYVRVLVEKAPLEEAIARKMQRRAQPPGGQPTSQPVQSIASNRLGTLPKGAATTVIWAHVLLETHEHGLPDERDISITEWLQRVEARYRKDPRYRTGAFKIDTWKKYLRVVLTTPRSPE
jgi:hypothetical protein